MFCNYLRQNFNFVIRMSNRVEIAPDGDVGKIESTVEEGQFPLENESNLEVGVN